VNPLVAKVVRNRLPRDVADRVVRAQRILVQLETPKVRAEKHDAARRDVASQLIQKRRMIALRVPKLIGAFGIRKRGWIDYDQIPPLAL
jgi:hypothetical protein